jgi:hypothetical protein
MQTIPTRAQRDAVRIQFFREFRGVGGCASVAVRTDRVTGDLFLSVGVSGDGSGLPAEYAGMPVRTYAAGPAVHAVQYPAAQA